MLNLLNPRRAGTWRGACFVRARPDEKGFDMKMKLVMGALWAVLASSSAVWTAGCGGDSGAQDAGTDAGSPATDAGTDAG
jgi:hypothetical protein